MALPHTVIVSISYPSFGVILNVLLSFSLTSIISPAALRALLSASFTATIVPFSALDNTNCFALLLSCSVLFTAAIANGLNESQVTIKPYCVTTQGISSIFVTFPLLSFTKWYALKVTPASFGP